MNRDLLDKWCERGILWLVLAILVFGPLGFGAVRPQEFLVIQAMTLGVMLLWGLRIWVNPRPQLLWPPICWSVLLFAGYAVGRYLTSDIEYVARQELVRVLVYAFLFLAIVNHLHRQEFTQLITLTLVFLAMVISFYAIYQFVSGSDKVLMFSKPYPKRGSGTFISPNNLGGFLEMILPLGLAWTLTSRAKPVRKVFVGYASLVVLAGIGATVSRGAWISTGLVLAIFFAILLFNRTYWLPTVVLLVVIVSAVFYFIPRAYFVKQRFEQITRKSDIRGYVRTDMWAATIKIWRENIWWGVGPGHFSHRFGSRRPQLIQTDPERTHNDYLNTLTDWGIAGVALVASSFILLYAGVFKTWRYVRRLPDDLGSKKSNKFALLLGSALGVLAILFHSVVDFNMQIPANAIVAITLMALATSCLRFATEQHWSNVGISRKLLLTLLLLGGMGYLSVQEVRAARECVYLGRAASAKSCSPEQVAALQSAFAIEPKNYKTAYDIAEIARVKSMDGDGDYLELAEQALDSYRQCIGLNRYYSLGWLRYGMCLDWLDRPVEARVCFDQALLLEPNGFYTAALMGWHYAQVQDYAAARVWCMRSHALEWKDNPVADTYQVIATQKLLENATNGAGLNPPIVPPEAPPAVSLPEGVSVPE